MANDDSARPDDGIPSQVNSMLHSRTEADPGALTHGDCARQIGTRTDVDAVSQSAIVRYGGARIYHACLPQRGPNIDDRARHDNAAGTQLCVWTDPRFWVDQHRQARARCSQSAVGAQAAGAVAKGDHDTGVGLG